MVIDGKAIAREILNKLKRQPVPKKQLAAVLFGEEPASVSFLKQKEKFAKDLGVDFRLYKFPSSLDSDQARQEVNQLADSESVGGIIVQLPLPPQFDRQGVLNAIPQQKDVDVLSEQALGAFYVGRNQVLPPAVEVVKTILATNNLRFITMKIAVVGLGFLVGKPIATWLMGKCAELYLLDQGSDLAILKNVDLVISGVGKSGLIKPEMLKDGAGIIDFGYEYSSGKAAGDLDVSSLPLLSSLSFHTPTPGGTGPILVAKLFENFYKLNGLQRY